MVVSVIGYPWSGKSTIAQAASDRFGFKIINTGEIIRSWGVDSSDVGEFKDKDLSVRYDDAIKKVVYDYLSVPMNYDVVLDGFPRSMEQVDLLKRLTRRNDVLVLFVYSNPVDILSRSRSADGSRHRLDDDVSVLSGRIEAVRGFQAQLSRRLESLDWGYRRVDLKDYRMSEVLELISEFKRMKEDDDV